jgi:hypothetical protein
MLTLGASSWEDLRNKPQPGHLKLAANSCVLMYSDWYFLGQWEYFPVPLSNTKPEGL